MPPFINVGLSIAEWKNYVASYDFGPIPPSRIVLHHTWKPTVAEWRGVASMKGMQNYYRGLGWTAAPHIYVGPDKIWLATPMSEVGIHAGSGNSGYWNNGKWSYSIGLELVGNYDRQRPSGVLWEQAKAVMGELSKRLGIDPQPLIYFHRDFSSKSCPGWAITKEWVWGEVQAYVNNAKPPKPPQIGEIGTPTPEEEELMERLLDESYSIRAEGYTSEWAFHQYAVENGMGLPLAKSSRITVDGKEYNFQPFARDTLYCEIPRWGDVQLLSELLGGSIPPRGLGRTLLESSYKASGATFHADWAFHQFAMSAKLGPAVAKSGRITVGGTQYYYQAFAIDTLYSPVSNPGDVRQLSSISLKKDAASTQMRDALLQVIYQSVGATYHPEWAFHQIAHTLDNGQGIGTPLGNSFKVTVGNTTYSMQVYATDALYNIVPNWSDVRRLKDLAHSKGMVSFSMQQDFGVVEEDAQWEPPEQPAYEIKRHAPASPSYSDRNGTEVSMVVIHGDDREASRALDDMTQFGTRHSTNYYISAEGTIYQLVDEEHASWHSGMLTLGGLWFNINSYSIGITLERMPERLYAEATTSASKGKSSPNGYQQQIDALRWLLRQMVQKYNLQPDDVVLDDSLVTSAELIPAELYLADVFA
jgi:hypothetical protein